MGRGTKTEGVRGQRQDINDDVFQVVERVNAVGGGKRTAMGDVFVGGVPPRFKTERQKQMWLRLKAKADAKNKTD